LDFALRQSVEGEDDERRRLASEALLARRLGRHMLPLDESRQVDATPVTHAEYQLFLDEAQPRGGYHQPTHWPGPRFRAGQGLTPIVGVRHLDAEAFCAWLNERTSGDWRYRLPRADERSSSLPLADPRSGAGYWVAADAGKPPALHGAGPLALEPETLVSWLNADIGLIRTRPAAAAPGEHEQRLARALAVTGILGHIRPLSRDVLDEGRLCRCLARAGALVLVLTRAHAFDPERIRSFDRALERALALTHALERDLCLAQSMAPARVDGLLDTLTSALALTGARRPVGRGLRSAEAVRAEGLARALCQARVRDPALVLARAAVQGRSPDLARAYTNATARVHDLARALARDPGLDRAPGLDRDFARAFSRTLAHAGSHARDLDLARTLSCALDLDLDRVWSGDPNLHAWLDTNLGSTWAETCALLRQHTRADALLMALAHYDEYLGRTQSWSGRLGLRRSTAQGAAHQRAAEATMDLYITLCILEERVRGALPAVEGIWLVRERVAAGDDD
jgi:hypothetical protein